MIMKKILVGLFAASLLLVANESMALTMYGGVGKGSQVNPGALLIVDQNTGEGTLVGDPITPGGLTGIAFDSTGALYGSTIFGFDTTSTLVQIDPDTGALINSIGDITVDGVPISIGDLAFQPGTDVLYGIRSNADGQELGGELYTIDTATGAATFVGLTQAKTAGGIAFAPDGTLFFAKLGFDPPDSALLTLDPTNASTISNVPLTIFFDGLAVRSDGILFAHATADVNGPDFDRRGEIYTINPTTGAMNFVGNTGVGFTSDLDFRPDPNSMPDPALIDLDPDVFAVAVTSHREPAMSGEAYLTAYIEPPDGVDATDIDSTTVTLSVNDTILATAESSEIIGHLLVVQFHLTPDIVAAILGVEVTYVEVDEEHNRIVIEATTAPDPPIDLIELIVSGENFSGTDAVRVIPGIPRDTAAPTIAGMTASPNVLWPPNHKMVPVTVDVSVSDDSDGAPDCRIVAVSSNEPVNGVGDGNTAPDWVITGDLTVNLRAERSGKRSGRVYTIMVECADDSGNNATETVTVMVPHHKWKFQDLIEWIKHHKQK